MGGSSCCRGPRRPCSRGNARAPPPPAAASSSPGHGRCDPVLPLSRNSASPATTSGCVGLSARGGALVARMNRVNASTSLPCRTGDPPPACPRVGHIVELIDRVPVRRVLDRLEGAGDAHLVDVCIGAEVKQCASATSIRSGRRALGRVQRRGDRRLQHRRAAHSPNSAVNWSLILSSRPRTGPWPTSGIHSTKPLPSVLVDIRKVRLVSSGRTCC